MHEPEYFTKLFREAFTGRLHTWFLENNRKALVNTISVNDSRPHFIHVIFRIVLTSSFSIDNSGNHYPRKPSKP